MRWKTETKTGWGRVHSAKVELARPERGSGVEDIMAKAPAPAVGMCRSYGDACLNDGGRAVEMTRLDRILSFDDATGLLEVEAGAQIGELNRIFAPRGWLPPVMPGTGFATIGGAIAMDVHGKNHHGAGSFGCHVESFRLATPQGVKTVKAGTSLFKATVGGLGQTGIILSAQLNMLRAKGDVMVVTERRVRDFEQFLQLFDASDATYSVGWIDATATGEHLGRGILEEAETGGGLVKRVGGNRRVPMNAPHMALSPPVVRAFNAAYWRRVPSEGRTVVKPIDDFFFPLDKIHDWNRLYGKRGFHQFQCVLPLSATRALREMLEAVASSGLGSPLAVLKRLGPGRAGYMSFPMEGWTLAVDFPNRDRVAPLIARLEIATRDAGGRIYLAKDALAKGDMIRDMYEDHDAWLKEVVKMDPDATLETDLVKRLNLRSVT